MPRIFEVGGSVRDSLLGSNSHDEDFIFVLDEEELQEHSDIALAFNFMEQWLLGQGFRIFLKSPECLTIRAKFPAPKDKLVADFVLARQELGYKSGTRQPIVVPGTLADDLQRRDFTINAIARDSQGSLIDLFEGQRYLEAKILRTPLNPAITLKDDPLRALRAVRFAVKLGFEFAPCLQEALHAPELPELMAVVSSVAFALAERDRIREELAKCFAADTWATWELFNQLPQPLVKHWLTQPKMWLLPTTKKA
jgi:tRNA nucleotidyltransferase/poly(A) polymerase